METEAAFPHPQKTSQSWLEPGLILLMAVGVYYIASHYDIFEWFVDLARRHEDWELDEIMPVAAFLTLALGVFSSRQWRRVRRSEEHLFAANAKLQQALSEIKQLRGIVPICSACKKIRDDQGFWHQVEVYVGTHTGAEFTHGICPDCQKKLYPTLFPDEENGETTDRTK